MKRLHALRPAVQTPQPVYRRPIWTSVRLVAAGLLRALIWPTVLLAMCIGGAAFFLTFARWAPVILISTR